MHISKQICKETHSAKQFYSNEQAGIDDLRIKLNKIVNVYGIWEKYSNTMHFPNKQA